MISKKINLIIALLLLIVVCSSITLKASSGVGQDLPYVETRVQAIHEKAVDENQETNLDGLAGKDLNK